MKIALGISIYLLIGWATALYFIATRGVPPGDAQMKVFMVIVLWPFAWLIMAGQQIGSFTIWLGTTLGGAA